MSVIVVSDKHINLVVAAILVAQRGRPYPEAVPRLEYMGKVGEALRAASSDPENFGRSLHVLNLRAHEGRYLSGETTDLNKLMEIARQCYRYQDLQGDIYHMSAAELHKLFFGFLYQCMDGEKFESLPLYRNLERFMLEISYFAIMELPEWKNATYLYS